MHPSPLAGFRVATLARLYAIEEKSDRFGFRLQQVVPDPISFERAMKFFERCYAWSVASMESRTPYFKFQLLAIDTDGHVAFGWLPFAVATPDGEQGAAGLPIHEYGRKMFLPETPEWYEPYLASGGHVVAPFEGREGAFERKRQAAKGKR